MGKRERGKTQLQDTQIQGTLKRREGEGGGFEKEGEEEQLVHSGTQVQTLTCQACLYNHRVWVLFVDPSS